MITKLFFNTWARNQMFEIQNCLQVIGTYLQSFRNNSERNWTILNTAQDSGGTRQAEFLSRWFRHLVSTKLGLLSFGIMSLNLPSGPSFIRFVFFKRETLCSPKINKIRDRVRSEKLPTPPGTGPNGCIFAWIPPSWYLRLHEIRSIGRVTEFLCPLKAGLEIERLSQAAKIEFSYYASLGSRKIKSTILLCWSFIKHIIMY